MVPEQLIAAVVEQHVEGDVFGVAPPFLDRPYHSSQGRTTVLLWYPHPLADPRFLREHAGYSFGELHHRRLWSLSFPFPRSGTLFSYTPAKASVSSDTRRGMVGAQIPRAFADSGRPLSCWVHRAMSLGDGDQARFS